MLEKAQVWKTQKLAKQTIERYYASVGLNQLEETETAPVKIKRLLRSTSATLQTETVESLYLQHEK